MAYTIDDIIKEYNTTGGRVADAAGANWWLDALNSGSKSLSDLDAGLTSEDKNAASVKGITNAGKVLGINTVIDPLNLNTSQKGSLIGDAFTQFGGLRPDQYTYDDLMKNWGSDFSDFNLGDQFDKYFGDIPTRLGLVGNSYAQGGSDAQDGDVSNLADLLKTLGMGGSGGGGGSTGAGGNPVDAYLSPYLQGVLDPAIRDLTTATTAQRDALGDQAFQAGAYGDARHGIESSKLTDTLQKNIADLSANVHNTGYSESMGWLGQDLDRQLQAAGLNMTGDQNSVSNALGAIGTGSTIDQNAIGDLTGLADSNTGLDQYIRNWGLTSGGWDASQLTQMLNSLGALGGYGSSTTGTSSTPNNSWAQILGALAGSKGLGG